MADAYAVLAAAAAAERPPLPAAAAPYRVAVWRPGPGARVAPGPNRARAWGWRAYDALGLFRTRELGAILVLEGTRLAHRSVVFPPYYSFPFMGPDDVQVGFTWTDARDRGQGLATLAVRAVLSAWWAPGRTFWYLADERNEASIRAGAGGGLARRGTAEHRRVPLLPRALGRYELRADPTTPPA